MAAGSGSYEEVEPPLVHGTVSVVLCTLCFLSVGVLLHLFGTYIKGAHDYRPPSLRNKQDNLVQSITGYVNLNTLQPRYTVLKEYFYASHDLLGVLFFKKIPPSDNPFDRRLRMWSVFFSFCIIFATSTMFSGIGFQEAAVPDPNAPSSGGGDETSEPEHQLTLGTSSTSTTLTLVIKFVILSRAKNLLVVSKRIGEAFLREAQIGLTIITVLLVGICCSIRFLLRGGWSVNQIFILATSALIANWLVVTPLVILVKWTFAKKYFNKQKLAEQQKLLSHVASDGKTPTAVPGGNGTKKGGDAV